MKQVIKLAKNNRIHKRVLTFDSNEEVAIIQTALHHYEEYFINRGWDKDKDMIDMYQDIQKVMTALNLDEATIIKEDKSK